MRVFLQSDAVDAERLLPLAGIGNLSCPSCPSVLLVLGFLLRPSPWPLCPSFALSLAAFSASLAAFSASLSALSELPGPELPSSGPELRRARVAPVPEFEPEPEFRTRTVAGTGCRTIRGPPGRRSPAPTPFGPLIAHDRTLPGSATGDAVLSPASGAVAAGRPPAERPRPAVRRRRRRMWPRPPLQTGSGRRWPRSLAPLLHCRPASSPQLLQTRRSPPRPPRSRRSAHPGLLFACPHDGGHGSAVVRG